MAGGLRAAIDEVLALDVSALSDAAVRAEFFEIAACAELLELARCRFAAALDGRGIPDADGAASTASWIQVETGQVRSEADAALRLGRSLDAFPSVEAAWAAGEITASAARMIVEGRRGGAESAYAAIESALVGFASRREFRSLRQTICYYRNHASAEHAPAEPEGLFLSLVRDSYVVSGTLDRYTGEMLSRAIDAATMPPACDDHRTPAQRRSEALGVVAKTFCDLGCGGAEHSNQAHLLVHVDWASLAAGTPFATMGRDGHPITREVLD